MPIDPKIVYEKCNSGQTLTDTECVDGMKFYKALIDQLDQAGPVFYIAAAEASRIYRELRGFVIARGLMCNMNITKVATNRGEFEFEIERIGAIDDEHGHREEYFRAYSKDTDCTPEEVEEWLGRTYKYEHGNSFCRGVFATRVPHTANRFMLVVYHCPQHIVD